MAKLETATINLVYNAPDVDLRSWVQTLYDLFTEAGWVQTTDTGQMDPTTIVNPNAVTPIGYCIWRTNHSALGLQDIYVKYRMTGNTIGSLASYIRVGWGSDGSGNLTGTYTSEHTLHSVNTWSASAITSYLSVGSNYINLLVRPNSGGFHLVIERLRDNNGEFTDEVVLVMGRAFSGNNYHFHQVLNPNYAFASYDTGNSGNTCAVLMPSSTNRAYRGRAAVGFIFPFKAGIANPLTSIIMNSNSATTPMMGLLGQNIQMLVYGELYTYKLLTTLQSDATAAFNQMMYFRWD